MLDDFRSQADTPFFDEDNQPEEITYETETRQEFLGMTPFQRFVIAIMILLITLLLSSFCLLVTGKVAF
ncbi:MAG TPA: hypothetical protein VN363_04700 [Anaerolineales bacterium]|nr:hypothetical protein [Anaerolineales bacterium]